MTFSLSEHANLLYFTGTHIIFLDFQLFACLWKASVDFFGALKALQNTLMAMTWWFLLCLAPHGWKTNRAGRFFFVFLTESLTVRWVNVDRLWMNAASPVFVSGVLQPFISPTVLGWIDRAEYIFMNVPLGSDVENAFD